jgi:hypothetical protein
LVLSIITQRQIEMLPFALVDWVGLSIISVIQLIPLTTSRSS